MDALMKGREDRNKEKIESSMFEKNAEGDILGRSNRNGLRIT